MEKMNQVSVSEFFTKSEGEMYDDAVAMVEKYNRLVDICNDSAERMAELMAKDDINEFKKELQSKEIGEFKIQKLADIVVWFDNWIEETKLDLTEEEMEDDETIKEFETIKKVILESIERHNVYTSALNNDIADKAAKIELLEKEIEGRKEGYYNLKDRLDTAREIEDHWKREYETLTTNFSAKSVELNDANNKINDLKEEIKKLNKCIMNKNESINTGNEAIINLRKEIGGHEDENKRLSEKIMSMHNTITELSHDIDNYKSWNASLHKDIKELKKNKEDDHGKSGFKRYIEHLIEEEERAVPERFKERLNKEITAIFTKEEETIKYRPSEIDRFTNFLKDEVDKKRIVDISYGVEDDLHVTRELLDTAIRLIVAKGYHDYEGVVTGYGRFFVLTTPDVEFKDLYDTWKIKSIGPDIPCGEDAIE